MTLRHLRSIKGEIEFNLPDHGLVLISAKNKDTGGSSGAGKSTFMLGLNTALDCAPYPMTELQSWGVDDPVSSSLDIETDKGLVSVTRGAKSSLRISGEKAITSAKAIKERMQQILGLTPEMLLALTYSPQQDQNDFLSLTNSEKQEFLSAVLGLRPFEAAVEVAQANLRTLEDSLRTAEGQIQVRREAHQQAMDALAGVAQPSDVSKAKEELENQRDMLTAEENALHLLKEILAKKEVEWNDALAKAGEEYEGPELAALEAVNVASQALKKIEAERPVAPTTSPELERLTVEWNDALKRIPPPSKQPQPVTTSTELQTLIAQQERGRVMLQQLQKADAEHEQVFRRQCQGLDTEIATIAARAPNIQKIWNEIVKLMDECKRLEASICPTCERQWDEAHTQVAQKQTKISELEAQLRDLKKEQESLQPLRDKRALMKFEPDPMIAKMHPAIENLSTQIAEERARLQAEYQAALAAHRAQIAELTAAVQALDNKRAAERQRVQDAAKLVAAEHDTKVAEVRRRVDATRAAVKEVAAQKASALNALKNEQWQERQRYANDIQTTEKNLSESKLKVRDLEARIERLESWNTQVEAQRVAAQRTADMAWRHLETAEVGIAKLQSDIGAEKDFIKAVGREGFMGSIFDEVLAEISAETNRILGRVANTGNVVLEFRSEIETKAGQTKKEIRPVVTIGGNEANLRSGCSGGMYSAVRLAVRLAVRHVISRRTGSFPAWLCLDESFDGLDAPSKEACFEILGEAAQEDLILVVDHSTEFKALFSKTISLEFSNGETRLAEES